MTIDGFEAVFRLRIEREEAWRRLTAGGSGARHGRDAGHEPGAHLWLPGFDSQVTVAESDPPERLRATKDEEPCAGTHIVVTLEDDDTGTRVRVVQSRFGDWLADHHEMMSVGWRYLVADLETYLATGVHARRHLRAWGDLGAEATAVDGGVLVRGVRRDGLAGSLGLVDGDLLVALAGAPVASVDDLVTILRVLDAGGPPTAEWVRSGALERAGPSS